MLGLRCVSIMFIKSASYFSSIEVTGVLHSFLTFWNTKHFDLAADIPVQNKHYVLPVHPSGIKIPLKRDFFLFFYSS